MFPVLIIFFLHEACQLDMPIEFGKKYAHKYFFPFGIAPVSSQSDLLAKISISQIMKKLFHLKHEELIMRMSIFKSLKKKNSSVTLFAGM